MMKMPTTTNETIELTLAQRPITDITQTTNERLQRLIAAMGEHAILLTPHTPLPDLESFLDRMSAWRYDNLVRNIGQYADLSGFGMVDSLMAFVFNDDSATPNDLFFDSFDGDGSFDYASRLSDPLNRHLCRVCHRYADIDMATSCGFQYPGYNHGDVCGILTHYNCNDYRRYCPEHEHNRSNTYHNPYEGKPWEGRSFTFGVELEVDGNLSYDEHMTLSKSPLIAGYCGDGSLRGAGYEYQTQPLGHDGIDQLAALVDTIEPDREQHRAGGHVHVCRGDGGRQTAGRWYWALHAFMKDDETRKLGWALNMRHVLDSADHDDATNSHYWCRLVHGEYSGKNTAINDSHTQTIELRTFSAWNHDTAGKLAKALNWVHRMWRFFDGAPLHSLSASLIERTALRFATEIVKLPKWEYNREQRETWARERREARERAAAERRRAMRERVLANIKADKRARRGHWKRYMKIAAREREEALRSKEYRRNTLKNAIESSWESRYVNTLYSFKPVSRLEVMRHMVRMGSFDGIIRVVNPATYEVLNRYVFIYETRLRLRDMSKRRATANRIKAHKPQRYSDTQIARMAVRLGIITNDMRHNHSRW